MKNKTVLQAIKFTLFSISAGLIQFGSFTLLNELTDWGYWACYLPSLALSIVWNFTFNRKFTFQAANNVPKAMLLAFLFYVPFTPLSTWWGNAMESTGVNEYLILGITMLSNFALEFLWQKFVVFRAKK